MKIDRYLQHVPEIERRIAELKPDALVFGMGPTAWLLPWIDQTLLRNVRLWTCHDGCRTFQAHDLVLMDSAVRALNPCTDRFANIVASRPQRIWCYPAAWKSWKEHLDKAVLGICTVQPFQVWHPACHPKMLKGVKLDRKEEVEKVVDGKKVRVATDTPCPDTIAISPTGMTTLAWAQGARRIGVLGVDMLQDHGHTSWGARDQVDYFFARVAHLAHDQGGQVANLSPITSLKAFAAWTPPFASSLALTKANVTLAPNESSNTASASVPPAT